MLQMSMAKSDHQKKTFEISINLFEIWALSVLTGGFELVTRRFELITCRFELATCRFELVTRRFEHVTRVLLFLHKMMIDILCLQRLGIILNLIKKKKKFEIYRYNMMNLEPLIKDSRFKDKYKNVPALCFNWQNRMSCYMKTT